MRTFGFINRLSTNLNGDTSIGKNENIYTIGSGVGSQSRFVRRYLLKKSSNKNCGLLCNNYYQPEPQPESEPESETEPQPESQPVS